MTIRQFFLLTLMYSCQHAARFNEPTISSDSKIPYVFRPSNYSKLPERLNIEASLMDLRSSNRSHTEVRQGPGVKFPLEEFLFHYGTPLAIIDSMGVWRKVLAVDSLKVGWVHYKALYPIIEAPKVIRLDPKKLPIVTTRKKATFLTSFMDQKKIATNIPKGAYFIVLSRDEKRHLVWLPQTNSAAWIENQFLH